MEKMMVEVQEKISVMPYSPEIKSDWDLVLDNSINGTFLHHRDFMEYHGDRFEDASLVIYYKKYPIAIFPANRIDEKLYSHQGLSYAGLILSKGIDYSKQNRIIATLMDYFKAHGFSSLEIKSVPAIYCKESLDSLEYLWIKAGAIISFSDLTYAIPLPSSQIGRMKRWKIRKSHIREIEVRQSRDFKSFWEELLIPNLMEKFGLQPAHSLREITYLNTLFPDAIRLFLAIGNDEILGGVCLFISERVAHAQYIAASAKGKKYKALDYLFNHLIHHEFRHLAFFDFGRNVDSRTMQMNEGLVQWKESYGSQPFFQRNYKLEIG